MRHIKQRWQRSLAGIFAALALTVGAAACSGSGEEAKDTLSQIKSDNLIRVGMANQPPYSGLDKSGKPNGSCTELVAQIFQDLGWEVKYFQAPWADLIAGLQADRWDIALCFTPTPERCATLSFSDPIEASTYSFAVPPGNPKNIASIKDVVDDKSIKLGMLTGSSVIETAKKVGVPEDQLLLFQSVRDELDALAAGRIDAALSGTIGFKVLQDDDKRFELTDRAPEIDVISAAMAFRKEDTSLRDAFNVGLKGIQEDGRFQEILKRYYQDPSLPLSQDTAELCKQVNRG